MESISTTETPMLRQYREIKSQHLDAILFFRLGDFYEMFLEDAKTASKELELTLTGRGKDEKRIPMCGLPYHAADSYISKLVSRGYKVAICEQTETPTEGKGLTKREVVKVITPGTIQDQSALNESENNYIAAIFPGPKNNTFGISFADISTGEFRLFQVQSLQELKIYLDRIDAKEILIPDNYNDMEHPSLPVESNVLINSCHFLEPDRAKEELQRYFQVNSLSGFGLEGISNAYPAAWQILDYLKTTQNHALPQITRLLPLNTENYLSMDQATIRNLELTDNLLNIDKNGTLFSVLNQTKTAMGARRLKHILKHPLIDPDHINQRLDAVESLKDDLLSREELRETLNQVYDLERVLSRIVSEHNNPRDCIALKQSIFALKDCYPVLDHLSGDLIKKYTDFFQTFANEHSPYFKIAQSIESALIETPPHTIKDGGFIQEGYSEELDQLILSFKEIKQWIATLENVEREKTGIKSLKVGFNKVFGYYLTIPNTYRDKVPPEYIRKQTLSNAERYITPELKEKESIILNGEERQKELERQLYKRLIEEIRQYVSELQTLAKIVSEIDCLQAFATVAQKNQYTRPEFTHSEDLTLTLENSRHPVLEKKADVHFIPNSIKMTKDQNRFILITGPNMAGKSTLMRQIALCVVMAQIGSFVPASKAIISPIDKLFTRIGALDNLYAGQSTFMVEMLETASILNNATLKSLILLDEIGRGTSTFDGMSIAGSVAEYIYSAIQARTLFATHYHELTQMEKSLKAFGNFSMLITEVEGAIIFNHKFVPGPADKSYGVHVAKMAGLPKEVIHKAEQLLQGFESEGVHFLKNKNKPEQLSLF